VAVRRSGSRATRKRETHVLRAQARTSLLATDDEGPVGGAVSGVAAERAAAWCRYLEAHARRLYATVTDRVRVAAALLASRVARRAARQPVYRRRGLPQRMDRADGAPRGGGGAGVPPRARLDSGRGGHRPGRRSAHRAVPRQSSGCLSLRKPLRFCRFCRLESDATLLNHPPAARTDVVATFWIKSTNRVAYLGINP
jgi:hypothetical protein